LIYFVAVPRDKIFISYSHMDIRFREDLSVALRAEGLADDLWYDESKIKIGDDFDAKIQQALEGTKIGILLLSSNFFASDYIVKRELPVLKGHAEGKHLALAILHVSAAPEEPLQPLKKYHAVNDPSVPLDKLPESEQKAIYVKLANWAAGQIPRKSEHQIADETKSFEAAVALTAHGDRWDRSYLLKGNPDFPRDDVRIPDLLHIDGEGLFQILFGDGEKSLGTIGFIFGMAGPADPTRYRLRVHVMTDDPRLHGLPWARISHQERRLAEYGWRVELHDWASRFPLYQPEVAEFPARIVLAGPDARHLDDMQRFFQQRWPKAPEPVSAPDHDSLRKALSEGSPRLLYYFGPASEPGLLFDGRDLFSWADLATLVKDAKSVSTIFLNLIGGGSFRAMSSARLLAPGAPVVLAQCWGEDPEARFAAGKAGVDWVQGVFGSQRRDPVGTPMSRMTRSC
jgi:hypothetical protein